MSIETILLVLILLAGFYMAWNIGANDVANSASDGNCPQTNRKPTGITMSAIPVPLRLPAAESLVVRIRRVMSSPNS